MSISRGRKEPPKWGWIWERAEISSRVGMVIAGSNAYRADDVRLDGLELFHVVPLEEVTPRGTEVGWVVGEILADGANASRLLCKKYL